LQTTLLRAYCALTAQKVRAHKKTVLAYCAGAARALYCALAAHLLRSAVCEASTVAAQMRSDVAAVLRKKSGDVTGLMGLVFEAATTERKLPGVIKKRYKVMWPDYPHEWSAYGYTEADAPLGAATADEVSNYDRVLEALVDLGEDAALVWAVAHSASRRARGPAWARLGRVMHLHPQTVKRRFERAMLELWFKINDINVVSDVDDAR